MPLKLNQEVTILNSKKELIGKGRIERFTTIGCYVNIDGYAEWFLFVAFSFI